MKAIVQRRYGSPEEVLNLEEIDTPEVNDNEALVRVHAASLHIGDSYLMRGLPKVMRAAYGLRRPKISIPGTDLSGTVESVGAGVTKVKPGDRVFGWCKGAFAEYAVATEDHFLPVPSNVSFEQAAAIGVSAFTALHGLRDHGKVKPGQKILINGASGGVGTFAVQIGKALGAEVTGVCSARNVELVESIGADHVIDYTREDFTEGGRRYDLIFDNVGSHSRSATRRALNPDGLLLSNSAEVGGWFGGLGHVVMTLASSLFSSQQGRPFLSVPNPKDLAVLREMVESEKITPVIDRTYPLCDASMAMAHIGSRHTRGTTVLTV